MGWTGRIGGMGRTVIATLLLVAPAFAQPPGQDQFVPVKELPPSEQMPAAPLLITAYAVFLVLVVFYLWTIWRRLNKVDADMRALEQRMTKR
jgi:type VI protein secretion system component VasF